MNKDEKCFECERPMIYNHHVVPKSLGGTKTVPLCEICHAIVHNYPGLTLYPAFIREQKIKQGEIVRDHIPFGYEMYKDGRLVEDKEEQDTIYIITTLYEREWTCGEIAEILNRKGIETYYDNRGRKYKNWKWTQVTVRKILREWHIYDESRKDNDPMPYGFGRLHGKNVKVENEQKMIGIILDLRKNGYNTENIVRKINEKGLRQRSKAAWGRAAVNNILRRSISVGPHVQPPYGFTWGLDDYTPLESEQKVIGIVDVLFERGLTRKAIVLELNGIGYRTRSGKEWTMSSMQTSLLRTGKGPDPLSRPKTSKISRRLVAPFGYKYIYENEERKKVSVLMEQKVLRLIEELYTDGYGCGRIVRELNRQGLRNRAGNEWKEKKPIRLLIRKNGFVKGSDEWRKSFNLLI